MTGGLFEYPQKAAFGRALPKSKVFAFGKVTRRLRDAFATEIEKLTWQFKLAPETINVPAAPNVNEIQVFTIELKSGIDDVTEDILRCIDNAIGFPIIFEVLVPIASRAKVVAAVKRPSEADPSKWVVGSYFSSNWLPFDAPRTPLPIALNLAILYEQLLRPLLPIHPRPGESLHDHAERCRACATKTRELLRVEAQLRREKQFNRKVELNGHLRALKAEVDALSNGKAL